MKQNNIYSHLLKKANPKRKELASLWSTEHFSVHSIDKLDSNSAADPSKVAAHTSEQDNAHSHGRPGLQALHGFKLQLLKANTQ